MKQQLEMAGGEEREREINIERRECLKHATLKAEGKWAGRQHAVG